jgi:hypothetical protein
MRISYERSGGLMGRKVNFSVDLDELPHDQAEILQQLLKKADFFNLPENLISRPVPDEFTYSITVETAKLRHMVRFSDTSMTDSLRPLLDDLSVRARSGRSKA